MHEATLAAGILRIAGSAAGERAGRVSRVTVSVGELAGVMPDALLFAFDALKADTPLAGAELAIAPEPARARCDGCGAEYVPDGFPYKCPDCGCALFAVIGGEDVFVKEIEIEE